MLLWSRSSDYKLLPSKFLVRYINDLIQKRRCVVSQIKKRGVVFLQKKKFNVVVCAICLKLSSMSCVVSWLNTPVR